MINNNRLTQRETKYPCRIINCTAKDWMKSYYNRYPYGDVCEKCPFMFVINHLAELEDKIERMEDDGK